MSEENEAECIVCRIVVKTEALLKLQSTRSADVAYVPQYHNDVFISYAHRDEQTADKRPGWVSAFESELRVQLGAELGDEAVIWFDRKRLEPGFVISDTIRYDLSRTAIFLRLESPSCWQSGYCAQELEWFRSPQLPLDPMQIGSRSRVISVIIRAGKNEHRPDRIDADFHQDGLPLDPSASLFRQRIARLAQALAEALRLMEQRRTPVYMPRPSVEDPDCSNAWNVILGELRARNYRHIPRAIRLEESDVQILDELRSAPLSIHLVSAPWKPHTKRRIDLARQCGKPMLVWISPQARVTASKEQAEFLASLPRSGVDLLEQTGLDAIKELLSLRLNPPAASPVQVLKAARAKDWHRGVCKIYLICDARDRKSGAWGLKQRIESAGVEVLLPETGVPDTQELRRDHLKKLKTTDGVLLYYPRRPSAGSSRTGES